MTDRELLELAAKAAGYEIEWCARWPGGGCYMKRKIPEPVDPILSKELRWDPLTDDGDALRLALKLGIQIGDPHQYSDLALACTNGRLPWAEYWEPIKDGDYCAATRRAIVRAAAEIGRAMS